MASRHRRVLTTAAALCAVLMLSACGGGEQATGGAVVTGVSVHDEDGMNGAVLTEPPAVPDITLTATDGEPYSLTEDTTKPLTLVFFGYTHCPDICQAVMADISSAMVRLDDAQRKQVDMLFITSDPARDDPATLRAYLDRFDPTFEGLTGDLDTIVEAGNALGVAIEKGAKLPSGGYEVTHGTQVIGIDAQDRAPILWTQPTPAGDLAEDIAGLLAGNG